MVKKVIGVMLILGLSVCCLAACGSKDDSSSDVQTDNEVIEEEEKDYVDDEDEDTEEVSEAMSDKEAMKDMRLSYEVPDGYEVEDIYTYEGTASEIFYEFDNDEDYKTLVVDCEVGLADPDLLDFSDDPTYVEIKDYTTKNGIPGVLYKSKDTGVQWFSFIDGDDYYVINGEETDDVMFLIDSMKIVK